MINKDKKDLIEIKQEDTTINKIVLFSLLKQFTIGDWIIIVGVFGGLFYGGMAWQKNTNDNYKQEVNEQLEKLMNENSSYKQKLDTYNTQLEKLITENSSYKQRLDSGKAQVANKFEKNSIKNSGGRNINTIGNGNEVKK